MFSCDRTRTVLFHQGPTPMGTGETFGNPPEDTDARRTLVVLDPDVWTDLELPDTITVTVEPGDMLNELPEGYVPVLDTASTDQLLAELSERFADMPGCADFAATIEALRTTSLTNEALAYRRALA